MTVQDGGEASSGAGVCAGGRDDGGSGAGDVAGSAVAVAARRMMKRESILRISESIVTSLVLP
jgi:hypothetical protein